MAELAKQIGQRTPCIDDLPAPTDSLSRPELSAKVVYQIDRCCLHLRSSERRREKRPRGLGSAASFKAETTTVAASSTSEPLPVKPSSRKASAASDGVCAEGLVPGRTGVAPPLELAAVLALAGPRPPC